MTESVSELMIGSEHVDGLPLSRYQPGDQQQMNVKWLAQLTLAVMGGILLIAIATRGPVDDGWREPPWFPPATPSVTH